MTENPRGYDLIDMVQTVRSRFKFVLLLTGLALVGALVAYFLSTKTYRARAEFFISNPLYGDRSNLFRTDQAAFINYFGSEEDIDKVMAIAKSEKLEHRVIDITGLAAIYKMDTANEKEAIKLTQKFRQNYDAKRTEYTNMAVYFEDENPKVAAYVANEAVKEIGVIYSSFYTSIRTNVFNSMNEKVVETDSAILAISQQLEGMPNKEIDTDLEGMKQKATFDQLIKDRAKYISLLGEFSTGTRVGELPLVNVISQALPPPKPNGVGLILTLLGAAIGGFAFAVLWVLMSGYYTVLEAQKNYASRQQV